MRYRPPAVAGQFYPGSKNDLREMLDVLFSGAKGEPLPEDRHITGLIAPHAGYVFSGSQAAKAYRYLSGRSYDLACIISPSHREYFPFISVFSGEAYRTPLGDCPVHSEAREILLDPGSATSSLAGHRAEHALEVQLPFIQYILGDIPILPLVMGDQGHEAVRDAENCVRMLYDRYKNNILFVASTDLSHFHSSSVAEGMDKTFIAMLERGDERGIGRQLETGDIEACGGGPVLALMRGLGKDHSIRTLGYSHSGMVMQQDERVVGYTSALIIKKEEQV